MVKLEWQNALFKSTKGKLKFIPVKIDDCIMPSLLFQNLHIDLYNYGFEVGISQIFNVINGTNTFVRTSGEFSNVIASLKYISSSKIEVEICAIHFHEPISHYLTIFKNNPETITLKVKKKVINSMPKNTGMAVYLPVKILSILTDLACPLLSWHLTTDFLTTLSMNE